jgi:serine/threonine protein kinase
LEYFVHAFGWFESSPGSFGIKIAMEYIPGGDLQVFVSDTRILSGTEAPKVIRQILKGLRLMHDSGFTHRDLKPEVVMSN